jgi:hypothetical protein
MTHIRRSALAALLLGLGCSAIAADAEPAPAEKPPLSAATSDDPATRSAAVVPESVFRKIKRDPLPGLPESGGMAKPGSTFPGVGDPLPPMSLPGGSSSPSDPRNLPNGLPQGLPGAPSGSSPDIGPAVQAGPVLSATFSGRSPSASIGGKVVRIGSAIKGSELSVQSIGDGFVVLSDGTEVEIGESVPREAKKKPAGKSGKKETKTREASE